MRSNKKYIAIIDNQVVMHETNLKNFFEVFSKKTGWPGTYKMLYDRFRANDSFRIEVGTTTFTIQRLVNESAQ